MPFPITIGGRTFNRENFRRFAYADEDTGLLAAFEAILDHVAASFYGVSTTSLTPSVAQKTLTVLDTNGQIATTFRPGDYVRVSDQAAPSENWMVGPVDSFDDETGQMVLSVEYANGTATISAWFVSMSGQPGPASGADANAAYLINGSNGGLPNALAATAGRGVRVTASTGAMTFDANAPTEVIIATTHTVDANDRAGQLHYTHSSGCAITLPAASGSYENGFPVDIVAEGGALTLTPASDTIEGGASYTVPAGKAVRVVSNGAGNWKVKPGGYTTTAKAKTDLAYGTAASQAIAALTELGFAAGVSIAAAASVAIGAAASPYVTITGDTTIAGFDSPASPVVRWLRFTGAPLLDGGSAFVIGDDIQITAGDTAMVRYASGVWYLLWHRRYDGTPTQRGFGWEKYTSSDTWSKSSMPAWAKGVLVIVDGGGGSGGAGRTSDSQRGGGGAGGGRAIKYIARADLGTTETVTVAAAATGATAGASPSAGNAGGTSSFGSHCSATGGAGGPAANGSVQAGVVGGTGIGGDLNYTGGDSPLSFPDGATSGGGRGGNSAGGGQGGALNVGSNGTAPGGGGAAGNHTAAAVSGAGARGEVILYYV